MDGLWIAVALGALLMVATTFVHAGGMVVSLRVARDHASQDGRRRRWPRPVPIAVLVLAMFLVTILEASLWALVYVLLGAVEDPSTSLYFSMVTYTTLGFGDITLDEPWRLLSAFEAANGLIMFGWTTAVIVAAVQRVYAPRSGASASP